MAISLGNRCLRNHRWGKTTDRGSVSGLEVQVCGVANVEWRISVPIGSVTEGEKLSNWEISRCGYLANEDSNLPFDCHWEKNYTLIISL